MDDISKRLSEVEKSVVAVSTKLDTALPHLATKADLSSMQTRIITWMVATALSSAATAFAVAKYFH